MEMRGDVKVTNPIVWQQEPRHPRLTKNPNEYRVQLSLETARRINPEILENSFNRTTIAKQSVYSRAQLDEFALYLGGTVRKDKRDLINFIKIKIKENFISASENVHI